MSSIRTRYSLLKNYLYTKTQDSEEMESKYQHPGGGGGLPYESNLKSCPPSLLLLRGKEGVLFALSRLCKGKKRLIAG